MQRIDSELETDKISKKFKQNVCRFFFTDIEINYKILGPH